MNISSRVLRAAAAAAALLLAIRAPAAELSLNFYPTDGVWPYEVESARAMNGVLLQNIAIINRGNAPVTIDGIGIDAVEDDTPVTTVRLGAARLDAIAAQGSALAQSGMMQALDFQFAPDTLLGKGVAVSSSRTLQPGTAFFLAQQMLVFRGKPQSVRVRVTTADETDAVTASLPIRNTSAPGTFRFPLQGRWFVGAGATAHSHHRWVIAEEFALDLLRIGEGGATYRGDGTRMKDYFAYGAPVLASADGKVVKAHDKEADNLDMLRRPEETLAAFQQRLREGQGKLLAAGPDAIAGNHVVVEHAGGVYSVYAHLKPGSVAVQLGDQVVAGQVIAKLGGSGNSTEPHLHFHLCDRADVLHCDGIPPVFANIEIPFSDWPRNLQTGDIVEAR
jgi:murein DD-endopeptidase MepM/ murein hydrolase activator NlpD